MCVGSTQRLHSSRTCRTQTSGLWHAATAHSASDFASFLVLLLARLSLLAKNENQYRSLLQSLELTLNFALPNAPAGRESAFPRRRFRLTLSRKIQTQRSAARGVCSNAHGGNGSNQVQRKQIPRKQTENRATRNNLTPKKRRRTKEPNKSSQTAFLQLCYSSKHNRRNPKHNTIALQTRRTSPGTRERGKHPFTHSLILPHSYLLRRSRVYKCLKQAGMSSLASKQTFSPTLTPATTDTLAQSQTMQRQYVPTGKENRKPQMQAGRRNCCFLSPLTGSQSKTHKRQKQCTTKTKPNHHHTKNTKTKCRRRRRRRRRRRCSRLNVFQQK